MFFETLLRMSTQTYRPWEVGGVGGLFTKCRNSKFPNIRALIFGYVKLHFPIYGRILKKSTKECDKVRRDPGRFRKIWKVMARYGNIPQISTKMAIVGKIDQIRQDVAIYDAIWLDLAIVEKISRYLARFVKTWQDSTRFGKNRQDLEIFQKIDMIGQYSTGVGEIRKDSTRFGQIDDAWQNLRRLGKIGQDSTWLGKYCNICEVPQILIVQSPMGGP